jgi:hypothetical protein
MLRLWLGLALLCLVSCGGPGTPPADGGAAAADRASVAAEVRPGLIELRRWREPRQQVVIDRAGITVGPAGGPLVRKLFIDPGRLEDLLYFLRTYASFRQRSATGEVAFGGQGSVRAGAVEQRMILEWARKVTAETEAGQSQDSYGLVLAWQRGGGGSCDGLVIYLDGEVRASSCSWSGESRGRLRPAVLARLDQGFDQWKPFQEASGMEAGRGVPVRLTFAGRGPGDASPQDMAALQALAAALHRELALRRGQRQGDATPPQPVPPGGTEVAGELESDAALVPEADADLLVAPAPAVRLPLPQAALPEYIPPPPPDDDDEAGPPSL